MNQAVETVVRGNFKLELHYDSDPSNPREDDNVAVLWCWHGRYNLGDHKDEDRPKDPILTEKELWHHLMNSGVCPLAIKPLYLFDHSGLTMRTTPFSCRWDSGQVGWAFVTTKKCAEEGIKRGKKAWAERMIDAEVKTYSQLLEGDVFGYTITKIETDEDGEEVEVDDLDSCWGFFGREYALEEAKSALDYYVNKSRKERFTKLIEMIRNKVPLLLRPAILEAHPLID